MAKPTARDKVIAAAQELMTGRGYRATTVDDIVNRAGVAKGSFYHSFKSKEELAIAALEDYERRGWMAISGGDYMAEADPVERALAFVQFIEDRSEELWSHGCLLGSVSIEVAETYPGVIKRIGELFDKLERGFEAVFEPALQARNVTDVSANDLAVHFISVIEGSIITAKSHFNEGYLQMGIRQFKHYVTLLLAEKPS